MMKNGVFQYPSAIIPFGSRKKVCFQAHATPTRTQRIMEGIAVSGEVGGAGGAYPYSALKRLDLLWYKICSASAGTLGIFIATALSLKGIRVGVVERNVLRGREQEWNISRKELLELVEVGVLTEDDIEEATAANFNPNRCGFEGKGDIWVQYILNLGVSPVKLVVIVKEHFDSLGGITFEGYSVSNISMYQDAAVLQLKEGKTLFSHLIIDAMGNFSPIVKQIRCGRKPDGICLVVGTCCRGFKGNSTSDVILSSASTKEVGQSLAQYFWERITTFPRSSGISSRLGPLDRTTYMFTYVDPQPGSPQLEELLEDYWDLMPKYQVPKVYESVGNIFQGTYLVSFAVRGVSLDDLEILRIVFGIFTTHRDGPLPAAFDRVIQFGDASGIQSPVSFGGFGSLTRHLGRLTTGVYEALEGNFLDSKSLSMLNPYMPNLSSSWLFQRAMSAKKQSNVPPDFINELLFVNFMSMQKLGDPVLRPFLQDVTQFEPLVKTLGFIALTRSQIIPTIFKQVGIPVLVDWSGHFLMLGCYTFLSTFIDPAIRPLIGSFPAKMRYEWKRRLEAWQYGAGLDYKWSPSRDR